MTILCDRCGRSYVARAVESRPGTLLRLLCPHCATPLWSVAPRVPAIREAAKPALRESKVPRGVS